MGSNWYECFNMSIVATYLKEAGLVDAENNAVAVIGPSDDEPVFNLEMASDNIYSLLVDLLPKNNVFPASTIESREYPDAVYNIASGPVQKAYGSTSIAYSTSYDVVIREKSHADLMRLVKTIENAVESSSGYHIADSADDYLNEENAYRMGLSIEISVPISSDLTAVPDQSIIVGSGGWSADPDNWDNCTRQRKHYEIPVIFTATSKAKLIELQGQVQTKLLGWTASSMYSRMQLRSGDELQADAGLYSAVDIYTHSKWVVKDASIA